MSDDLVKKLRSQIGDDIQEFYSHEALFRLAADRIEELEKQLRWVLDERDATFALMLKRAETAEAKLAKAVEGLMFYADKDKWIREVPYLGSEADADSGDKARTTLAELTGGDND